MQENMMSRLSGIVTFKAPVYKEVAKDKAATQSAAIIVVVVAIVAGVVGGLLGGGRTFIVRALITIVGQLIGWGLGSWLLAFIAKQFFKGDTDTGEMLRITGYTSIFNLLAIIPFLGFIGSILQIVGNVIGIREAAGFSTQNAILTAIISGVIVFIVTLVIGAIFTAIFIGAAVVSGGLNR
jgi:hypothetical protein